MENNAVTTRLRPHRFPEILFQVINEHHVQEMDRHGRIVAWADSGDGFVIFDRTELRSLVRERLGEEGAEQAVRDDEVGGEEANDEPRFRALEHDNFWRENLENYGFVWNDRAPVGWYVRHRDNLFQRGNIHAVRTIRFEDEETRRLRDTGTVQMSIPMLGRYIRAGMYDEAMQRYDTHRYEVKLLPLVPYNLLYEIADDDDVPIVLVQRLIEADCGKAMFVDSNPLGQLLFHRMACTELTDPRRNMVLQLLLQRHPHIVYEADSLGNTVLDEFATAWDDLWSFDRGRAGRVTDGNDEDNGNEDDDSDDDSEDREKRQLQEDLRRALDTAEKKTDLSDRLRLVFDRYVMFLHASTNSLMKSRPPGNSRLVAPHPSKTSSFRIFRDASPNQECNKMKLSDDVWQRWSVFMDAVYCQCRVSGSFFQLARRFAPACEGWIKDLNGRVPLATFVVNASTCFSGAEVPQGIASIVRSCPGAAAVRDERGRLPLQTAVDCGLRWEDGVDAIFRGFPNAIQLPDPCSGFFPFMVAALKETRGSSQPDVTTIYHLLRQCPSVLSGFHGGGRNSGCSRVVLGGMNQNAGNAEGSLETPTLKHEDVRVDTPHLSQNPLRRAADVGDDDVFLTGRYPMKRQKKEEGAFEVDVEMAEWEEEEKEGKEEKEKQASLVKMDDASDSVGEDWMKVAASASKEENPYTPEKQKEDWQTPSEPPEFELFFRVERNKILDLIPEFTCVFENDNAQAHTTEENRIVRDRLIRIIRERWNHAAPAVLEEFRRRVRGRKSQNASTYRPDNFQEQRGEEGDVAREEATVVSSSVLSVTSASSSIVMEQHEEKMTKKRTEGASAIVMRLQNNESLPCVILNGTKLQQPSQLDVKNGFHNVEMLPPLVQALKTGSVPRQLSLVACQIGDAELELLSDALHGSIIESLDLSQNNISGLGLGFLSKFLKSRKTHVKCIDLSSNHIRGNSDGLSALAHWIGSVVSTDIRGASHVVVGPGYVSLAANPLCHEGTISIATALQRRSTESSASSLIALDMSKTNMSVAAAEAFAGVQQTILPFLAHLDIRDNAALMNQPVAQLVEFCNRSRLGAIGVLCDDGDDDDNDDYDDDFDDDDELLFSAKLNEEEEEEQQQPELMDQRDNDEEIEKKRSFAYNRIEKIRYFVDRYLSSSLLKSTPPLVVVRENDVIQRAKDIHGDAVSTSEQMEMAAKLLLVVQVPLINKTYEFYRPTLKPLFSEQQQLSSKVGTSQKHDVEHSTHNSRHFQYTNCINPHSYAHHTCE